MLSCCFNIQKMIGILGGAVQFTLNLSISEKVYICFLAIFDIKFCFASLRKYTICNMTDIHFFAIKLIQILKGKYCYVCIIIFRSTELSHLEATILYCLCNEYVRKHKSIRKHQFNSTQIGNMKKKTDFVKKQEILFNNEECLH